MKSLQVLTWSLAVLVLAGCCGWAWWGGCYYDDPYYYYKPDAWEPEDQGTDLGLLPAETDANDLLP